MMSKTINLVAVLLCCVTTVFSQQQVAVNSAPAPEGYDLEVEVVSENIGFLSVLSDAVDLTGYSSTRLYVTMNNADDFMSSVSGDVVNPTYVNTTTSFHHALLGAATPNGINSLLFPVYPDLAYDSWVTIGLEGAPNAAAGEAAVSTVQSTGNPWATNFDPGAGLPGGNIVIDDPIGGAWYALNGDANGVAGDDLKVLVGQFTTDGDLSGQLYTQVFINGDGANEFRDTFFFGAGAPQPGCTDEAACNYDPDASEDNGSCEFPADLFGSANLDCDGNCLNDADEDGICDEDEVLGCTNLDACNYNEAATDDDGSCALLDDDCDSCDGNGGITDGDADNNGICDVDQVDGCTNTGACNYNPLANADDESCEFTSCAGCTDVAGCNYDATATIDDGGCTFPDGYPSNIVDCAGNCLNDADGDLVCDEDEIPGCTDDNACNFSASATDDNGSCSYPDGYPNNTLDCDGNCINDADGDLICDEDELGGCTDPEACNAGDFSDTDNSLCEYPDGYPENTLDCAGNCINDADGDLVCDEDEVPGCTDDNACNFDASATDNNGSCQYPVDLYGLDYVDCDGNCLNDEDGDLICDEEELAGCTDPEACNTGDFSDTDNDLCIYAVDVNDGITNLDCDGNCYNDADGDLVCDEDEIVGCQDDAACNYDDPSATDAGCLRLCRRRLRLRR